jgi:hypothetical protein
MKDRTPRLLKARFDSVCPETGKAIRKGDDCVYYPADRKAYHVESKAAEEYRAARFARSWGMACSHSPMRSL